MELKEDYMTDSYLKTDAFSYMGLHKKAQREIDRLITSENGMDIISSVDHALNAAFSIFHLLEWKDNLNQSANAQAKKPKARYLCEKSNNKSLLLLHDVVTRNKHVTVSSPLHSSDIEPKIEEDCNFLCTQSGDYLVTEDNRRLVTEGSKIIVYFGDEIATNVLSDALGYFNAEN
ncbi:hypothetical protein [Legionella genomosp. 1]|uniref:hypothetical protein n=1 Tax=Legionella genomosp. 1 TaxID=1093625 RepID=UPI0010569B06|nr:hypothetical protein [Legionella genomosp. 1]